MPFNSDTFFANKARKQSREEIAEARAIKLKIANGEARSSLDTVEHIQRLVNSARLHSRLFQLFRREARPRRRAS